MDDETKHEWKVGDELAFRSPQTDRWRIMTVERITPAGALVCGDTWVRVRRGVLTVISGNGSAKHTVRPVTDEIRHEMYRHEMIDKIRATRLEQLTTEAIEQIYRSVSG
jgi:hypothetical protein